MTRLRLAAAFLIPPLLSLLATGCGASPSAQQGSAADSTDDSLVGSPGQADQTFNTIVSDNSAEVTLIPSSPGLSCAGSGQEMFELAYYDNSHFFAGAASIGVWVKISAINGSSTSTVMDGFVTLPLAISQYLNEVCVSGAPNYRVALAFTDNAHDQWDSNNSKNYELEFTSPGPAGSTNLSASFNTVDGNQGDVDVDTNPSGNTNCAGATFNVSYADKTGYFSGAGSINIWMRADVGGTVFKLPLQRTGGNPTTYSLSQLNTIARCISPSQATGQIELAFANSSWTKWDSNNSNNYVVTPH